MLYAGQIDGDLLWGPVKAGSGWRSEAVRFGVLPYPWFSHNDTRRKEGKNILKGNGGDERTTGTPVDPQTGELARLYIGLNT